MIIGIGIDLVEIERIHDSVEKFGHRFLDRIFTQAEIEYCQRKAHRYQHFAARFAAKESILKAIGTGLSEGITWHEIEIVNNELGKPVFVCKGNFDRILREFGVENIYLSLSHSQKYAIAMTILEKYP